MSISLHSRRFVLIGGFLGSGKTSAISLFAKWLQSQNLTPGLITNDQGHGLIDTALGRNDGASVQEVTGGCFCCRANALGAAMEALVAEGQHGRKHSRRGAADVDVFVAEPVGSCMDLIATVLLPLRQIFAAPLNVAPLSVVADVARLEAVIQEEAMCNFAGRKSGFTADVKYIFDKQLEEAELIVLNKIDLLPAKRITRVRQWLAGKYPTKEILEVSTRSRCGLEEWFRQLLHRNSQPANIMHVDYERYGMGEARMGWLNASASLHSTKRPLNGNKILLALARSIQSELEIAGAEIAHFKMSLGLPENGKMTTPSIQCERALTVVQAVRNGTRPMLTRQTTRQLTVGELVVNLRAEAEPELLTQIVAKQLLQPGNAWHTIVKQLAAFKPGQPAPTYRASAL